MNSANSHHDPFFCVLTSQRFQRNQIADLAAGRCAAIRVPGFMPPAMCEETLGALARVDFDCYGTERVYPPVMRFGVGVSDYRKDGEVEASYWDAVDVCRDAWLALHLPFDPFRVCREGLAADWPNAVAVGRRGDREMAPGVAREPNGGFVVHFDDADREFSGNLLDANLIAQFAFNLYLSVPQVGGETVVWRHRWHPADEAFRLPHSYGYTDAVVDNTESFELKPAVGEALLFNPRNFHAVRPSRDARRIALGFSMGLSDTGELLTWG
jgi:hypothetical protein